MDLMVKVPVLNNKFYLKNKFNGKTYLHWLTPGLYVMSIHLEVLFLSQQIGLHILSNQNIATMNQGIHKT